LAAEDQLVFLEKGGPISTVVKAGKRCGGEKILNGEKSNL